MNEHELAHALGIPHGPTGGDEPAAAPPRVVTVADGTQVGVDGHVYAAGETIQITEDLAQQAQVWIRNGWAIPVDGAKPRRPQKR